MRGESVRRRRSSWNRLTARGALLLSATLLVGGCCSSASIPTPKQPIPLGKPADKTKELRWRVIKRPTDPATLDVVLADRLAWKTWALALEAAGDWETK